VWTRAVFLLLVVTIVDAAAQSPSAIPYPRDYKKTLVKYATVDRPDGLSRDLYVSRDAVDALKRDPQLRELPAGVLFALDVYSAKPLGKDAQRHGLARSGRAGDQRKAALAGELLDPPAEGVDARGDVESLDGNVGREGVPLEAVKGEVLLGHDASPSSLRRSAMGR